MATMAMSDALESDGAVYVLNARTTHDQFDSVCRTVDVNSNLQVSCDDMQNHNLQAFFSFVGGDQDSFSDYK